MARLDEGLTISRAVEVWFSIEESGGDPLQQVVIDKKEPPTAVPQNVPSLADISQQWVEHCLQFDKSAAERVLSLAFAVHPVKTICLEVLLSGVSMVGDMWYENEATEQQEHFISALTIQHLDSLIATAPPPTRTERILIVAPPQEEHTIALLVLVLLLRLRGWDVVYLGANVPGSRIEEMIAAIRPDLVVMGAQQLQTAASLAEVARILQEKGIRVGYGGRIFQIIPSLHNRVPGHYLGDRVDDAVAIITNILVTKPVATPPTPLSSEYMQSMQAYRAKRPLIELDTLRQLLDEGIPFEHLESTNTRFSNAITAALNLGNIAFTDAEIDLSLKLLSNYGVSLDVNIRYFQAFYKAARKHLGKESPLVTEWLKKLQERFEKNQD